MLLSAGKHDLSMVVACRGARPATFRSSSSCGREHVGGEAQCRLLHPNLVPASLSTMLATIHAKRKKKGLEDLSEKYPAPGK